MNRAIVTLLILGLGFASHNVEADEVHYCPPASCNGQFSPHGGWFPDCGGLLGWFPRCCFPYCTDPDDYCRKPAPDVCWPKHSPADKLGPRMTSQYHSGAIIRDERLGH